LYKRPLQFFGRLRYLTGKSLNSDLDRTNVTLPYFGIKNLARKWSLILRKMAYI